MTSFDLAQLDTIAEADKGAAMALLHPVTRQPLVDAAGQPIAITLAGMDSQAFRAAQRAATNKRLAQRGRAKLTAEELDAEQLDTLARCTLSWSGIVLDGAALPCTTANARQLYERLPWVREQADEYIADRANFIAR